MFFLNSHQKTNHLNELVVARSSIMDSQTKFKKQWQKTSHKRGGDIKSDLRICLQPNQDWNQGIGEVAPLSLHTDHPVFLAWQGHPTKGTPLQTRSPTQVLDTPKC